MEVRVVRRLLLIAVLLIVPATSYAQDATLSGTVKDTSGGVLPGVTVTALHEATGNTFVAVTDGVGAFRLPVRTGSYRITVELAGFATVVRSVNLLLGQTAAVDWTKRGVRPEYQSQLRPGDRRELQQQRREPPAAHAVRSGANESL
jgi:hypothetical protein